jgi:hypothetical protein
LRLGRRPRRTSTVKSAEGSDLDWFLTNVDCLVDEYPNEWLAIVDRTIAAHARSPVELRERVNALGLKRVFLALAHPDALAPYK